MRRFATHFFFLVVGMDCGLGGYGYGYAVVDAFGTRGILMLDR